MVLSKLYNIALIALDCTIYYGLKSIDKVILFKARIMKNFNVAPRSPTRLKLSLVICRTVPAERGKVFPFITRSSNLMYIQLWGQNCEMLMTSVTDHLLGYEFTGTYSKWYSCHLLSLFDAPVFKQCLDENYVNVKIKRTLEREVRSCDALII